MVVVFFYVILFLLSYWLWSPSQNFFWTSLNLNLFPYFSDWLYDRCCLTLWWNFHAKLVDSASPWTTPIFTKNFLLSTSLQTSSNTNKYKFSCRLTARTTMFFFQNFSMVSYYYYLLTSPGFLWWVFWYEFSEIWASFQRFLSLTISLTMVSTYDVSLFYDSHLWPCTPSSILPHWWVLLFGSNSCFLNHIPNLCAWTRMNC